MCFNQDNPPSRSLSLYLFMSGESRTTCIKMCALDTLKLNIFMFLHFRTIKESSNNNWVETCENEC